jgi:hypothetical protein
LSLPPCRRRPESWLKARRPNCRCAAGAPIVILSRVRSWRAAQPCR